MCGRYSVLTEDEVIAVREIIRSVSLRLARDEFDKYERILQQKEVFPTNRAPVITGNGNEMAFELGQFGFERWDGKGVIINARAETVKEKAMFKNHIGKGRCVVPASGYYEWKQPGEEKKKKIKHLIKDSAGNLLFMAGLYRDGKDGREFVIITKDPVGQITEIHDRMPVMLRVDQLEDWLSGAMPVEALASMDYDCAGAPCEAPDIPKTESSEQISMF
jgi:putative SOS response-associated peptidase YedK